MCEAKVVYLIVIPSGLCLFPVLTYPVLKTAAGNNRFKYFQHCSIKKKEAAEIHFCNKGCAYKLPSVEYRNYRHCVCHYNDGWIHCVLLPYRQRLYEAVLLLGRKKPQSITPTNLKVSGKAFINCGECTEFCLATAYSS